MDLADSIAKKLLHLPQMALRNDHDEVPLVVAVQRLFGLEVAEPAPVEEPEAADAAVAVRPDKKAAGQ